MSHKTRNEYVVGINMHFDKKNKNKNKKNLIFKGPKDTI